MVSEGSVLIIMVSLYQSMLAFFVVITLLVCAVSHIADEHASLGDTIDLASYLIVENVIPFLRLPALLITGFFLTYLMVTSS